MPWHSLAKVYCTITSPMAVLLTLCVASAPARTTRVSVFPNVTVHPRALPLVTAFTRAPTAAAGASSTATASMRSGSREVTLPEGMPFMPFMRTLSVPSRRRLVSLSMIWSPLDIPSC